MQINNINPISFKAHYVNVDIGASSINGSMKVRTLDENGNVIDNYVSKVFDEGQDRSEDKFEQNIANKVAAFEYKNMDKILQVDPNNELYLTVCYPGAKISENGKDGFKLPNFFYDDNRQNRFQRAISPDNIDKYLASQNINVVQTRHVNDMAGAGACILDKLQKESPELLKEGQDILFLYPGGGLGSGFLTVDKDNIKIRPSEMQHTRKSDGSGKSLEADVGVPGFISNFADAMKLTDEEKKIMGNDARAVREYDEFNKYFPDKFTLEEHQKASKIAINKFMDSLTEVAAIQVCSAKIKSVVITGNVANGVRDVINNDTEGKIIKIDEKYMADGCDRFTGAFRSMVYSKLTEVGKLSMPEPTGLTVKTIRIKDNTEGAQVLQKCDEVGKPAQWYNMKN